MIYWKWEPFMRGRQSLGRGLCNVAGELAPRGEAVKELGSVVEQYGKVLFEAHLKKPQAAILMDMVGLLKTLEQSAEAATNKFITKVMQDYSKRCLRKILPSIYSELIGESHLIL